jgi:TPR repeat protein
MVSAEGLGIPVDFTVAAEFFKKAADSGDADGLNSFGCCLEQGQGVDADIDLEVRFYRKAASLFHPDGLDNFGRCLEHGKGIDQDLLHASTCYRLSAELTNGAAQNSFGIFLERVGTTLLGESGGMGRLKLEESHTDHPEYHRVRHAFLHCSERHLNLHLIVFTQE